MTVSRGKELISTLLRAGSGDPIIGEASYELLNLLLASDYSIDHLGRLLRSENEAAVRAGAWIASELPRPLAEDVMDDLPRLLESADAQVRFSAVETVLMGASSSHGAVVATALTRMEDPHPGVRHAVMRLMAWLETDSLVSALDALEDSPLRPDVAWLTAEGSDPQASRVIQQRLSDPRRETRLVAAAAATRIAAVDDSALRAAIRAEDVEVAEFAREQNELHLWTRIDRR